MSVWKMPERITSSSIVTGSGKERGIRRLDAAGSRRAALDAARAVRAPVDR